MTYSQWISAAAGAALVASSLPASAQVARVDRALLQSPSSLLTDVQFRSDDGPGFRRPPGGGFRNRGFGDRGFGGRGGWHRGGGNGAAIGAGIAGLAAGALIGGAIASQPGPGYGYGYGGGYGYGYPGYAGAPAYVAGPGYGYAAAPTYQTGDASAYCAQRFKSYDPGSGTYLGYDGLRHPCP